jgi:hypothetical protein
LGIRVPAPALRIVSDALWNDDQTRADDIRAAYLHATNGTAWGRPTNATEPKASCVFARSWYRGYLPDELRWVRFDGTIDTKQARLAGMGSGADFQWH